MLAQCGVNDALDLVRCGNIDADLQLRFAAIDIADRYILRHVLRHVATALRILQQCFQTRENLLGLHAGQIGQQVIAKLVDARCRQLSQLLPTDARIDVVLYVLAILIDGGTLAAFEFYECNPSSAASATVMLLLCGVWVP